MLGTSYAMSLAPLLFMQSCDVTASYPDAFFIVNLLAVFIVNLFCTKICELGECQHYFTCKNVYTLSSCI